MNSYKLFILMAGVAALVGACCKDEQEVEECIPRESGRYLKSAFYTDGSGTTTMEYTYNEKRQLIKKQSTIFGDTVTHEEATWFTYDDCGKLLTQGPSDTSYNHHIYYYDAEGRYVRIDHRSSWGLYQSDSITYDGNKISIRYSYWGGAPDSVLHEYTIDPITQNVISSKVISPHHVHELLYEYDDKINPYKKMPWPLNPDAPWQYSVNNMVRVVFGSTTIYHTYTYDPEGYPLTIEGLTYEYVEL